MVTIVRVRYNNGMNECYAIKNRNKYIPIFLDELSTAEFKNITDEQEVELDILGRIVNK